MSNPINAGLNPAVIAREGIFGTPPLDFTGSDKGYILNQNGDTPINVTNVPEMTVVRQASGSQISKNNVVVKGNDNTSANFSNSIGNNDFMPLAAMFFQNDYDFVKTITDGSITAIVNDTDNVTLTLADAGTIAVDDIINVSGRADSDEDGNYIVTAVSTNDVTFVYVGGFTAADLTGDVNKTTTFHSSKIENIDDCSKQLLDSSYSIYLPRKFERTDCAVGEGEIYSGVVPVSLGLDFLAGTYTCDTIGAELDDTSNNLPKNDGSSYIGSLLTDNLVNINQPMVIDSDGDVQEALALTMDITLGTENSQKVRKVGKLNRAVVDGVNITGNWQMLFLTQKEADNYSAYLYENRASVNNEAEFKMGIEHVDGSSLFVSGNYNFMNVTVTKETGGWILSADYEMLLTENAKHVTLECVNGYHESMASLFRS